MKNDLQTRILGRDDFQLLLQHTNTTCVSIFLPTHRTGREQKQDRIRLRNLLRQAANQLQSGGMRRPDIESLLEPIEELEADELFWQHCSEGLAVFRSGETFRCERLPIAFTEQLLIGERFFVKPLLPLLHSGGRFFVLALSQDSSRLFESTRDAIHEIDLPQIARTELDGHDTNQQLHSQRRGARAQSEEAIYHGHGGAGDRTETDTLNYFHRVNDAVTRVLKNEDAPLVLACVGYLASLYETANAYSFLIKAKVPGSPSMWREDELREQAWKLVQPHFQRRVQASLDAVRQAAGKGNVLTDIGDAVVAAQRGRVETLLLASGEQQWGHVDPQHEAVQMTTVQGDGVELLNYAAAETLNHGGSVFVVSEIDGFDSPIAAVPRS